MKLAGIWNVFDGLELLEGSIRQIRDHLDCVIVVSQTFSNWGEKDESVYPFIESLVKSGLVDAHLHYDGVPGLPMNANTPMYHETAKRQLGIDYAKREGYTHFIGLDCDEYYDTEQFRLAAQDFGSAGEDASLCNIITYYKKPTLRFESFEDYFVPFIHRLYQNTRTGAGNYPERVDPTRGVCPFKKRVKLTYQSIAMHHFSWVRRDIEKKIRNSTARRNINTDNVRKDYTHAKPGYFVSGFGMRLIEVENKFGIDDFSEEGKNVPQHTEGGR